MVIDNQVRQGDVLLTPVNSDEASFLLVGAQPVAPEEDRLILARGEATGHHHSVMSAGAMLYILTTGALLLRVMQDVSELQHQEHGEHILPPGDYLVDRQREQTLDGIIVPVRD